jgi:hypothetical protein
MKQRREPARQCSVCRPIAGSYANNAWAFRKEAVCPDCQKRRQERRQLARRLAAKPHEKAAA